MRSVPAVLASLLLAAHFLRSGSLVLVLAALGLNLFLLARGERPRLVHRLLLVAGGVEWVRTTVALAELRVELGEPWLRMAAILGAVALFTFLAAALLPRRPRPAAS